jgi:hypothetical protein
MSDLTDVAGESVGFVDSRERRRWRLERRLAPLRREQGGNDDGN